MRPAIGPKIARGDKPVIRRVARVWVDWPDVPSAAAELGVRRETLYRWVREHPELRREIERLGGETP